MTSVTRRTVVLMPQPSLTPSKWTKRCSLSTSCQPSPCQATCQSSGAPSMWSNHQMVSPGCTQLPPRLSWTNSMAQQPRLLWLKQATQPNTRQQQLRHNTAILPHYSSTHSASKHTRTSRRRSTTMPSWDLTQSLTPTTRSSSSWTSINPHTNSTSLAMGVAFPSRRMARQQWQQWQQQRRWRWHHLKRKPPHLVPGGERQENKKFLPTV
jgi:hypothetical protein